MMPLTEDERCENCRYYIEDPESSYRQFGKCTTKAMEVEEFVPSHTKTIAIEYCTNQLKQLIVGKDFGCIHFNEKD